MFLLLALAAGWGSSAWAERLTPEFESAYSANGHWYNITYWTNGNYYAVQDDGQDMTFGSEYVLNPSGLWQLIGNQSSFVLVSKTGLYVKWDGTKYIGTSSAGEATDFSLIDMQGDRADYWGIHRNSASANQVLNPTGSLVKEYNNDDNGSSVKFIVPTHKASSAPTAGAWAADTQWYKIHNVRAAQQSSYDGYMSTADDHKGDNDNLKLRVAGVPEDDDANALWCIVPADNSSFYIYNKAAGTNQVMGTINNAADDATYSKMYEGTGTETNITKTYKIGNNIDGFWICLTGTNKYLDDASSGYIGVWENNSSKSSDGNRFIFTEVQSFVEVECSFDPVAGDVSDLSTITVSSDAVGLKLPADYNLSNGTSLPVVLPRLIKAGSADIVASSITSTDGAAPFVIEFSSIVPDGDYTLVLPQGTFYSVEADSDPIPVSKMMVNYTLVNPPATEGYHVIINGDNGYIVSTSAAVKSGNKSAVHDGFLDLVAAPDLKDLRSLTISCTDKFVWGPVVDNTAKTITYTVKDPVANVASLSEGFYQLEMVEASQDSDFKTRLANILKTSTVNVKSNNYYVMPWYDNSSYLQSDQVYKYSGVYTSGYAPASFVYLKRDGSGNLHFQSINGHYSTRPDHSSRDDSYIASANYKIENNKFSIKGWVKQAYWNGNASSGDEGPHEAYGDGNTYYEFYYAAKADLSDYNVYKVDFGNWTQGGSLKDDPTATFTGLATCYGLPTVYRNGYFFFPKDYTPVASDFSVNGITYTEMIVAVSDADVHGIYTLTFKEKPTSYPLAPTTEYTLDPADGHDFDASFDHVTVNITLGGGKTVQSAKEKNGSFTADELPYLIPSSTLSNHRAPHKAAPAGAIVAADVEKTSEGVYSISFSPAVADPGYYTLVVPEGAFYVTSGSDVLPTTEFRAVYSLGEPYEWVTIKNARKANGFLSLAASGLNASEQLQWGVSSVAGAGEYWAFVGDDASGYQIINKAYGPDYFLGIESTNNESMIRMYHHSEANANNTRFDKVVSTNANATGGFCILLHSNHNVGISDFGGSTLKVWAAGSENEHKGDHGSGFFFNSIDDATIAACPSYDIYKVVIDSEAANPTVTYTGAPANVLGLTTIQNNRYIALKKSSGEPVVANFTVSPAIADPLLDIIAESASAPATLRIHPDYGVLGSNVELRFTNVAGTPLPGASVLYTPEAGAPVVLSTTNGHYDFGGVTFDRICFGADTGNANFTYGNAVYDKVNSVLTFILSPHTLPTGIYRLSFSTQDRGNLTDIGSTYNTLGRNAWQQSDAPADNTNSLWYVCKQKSGEYTIASLSSYGGRGDDLYFLKGAQTNTFSINEPTPWTFTYKETRARGFGNGKSQFYGNYDQTIPTPDYFEIRSNSLGNNQYLAASPGYGVADRVRPGGHEVEATYIEFNAISETEIAAGAQRDLYNRLKTDVLNGDVNVAFVDGGGNPTTAADVVYHPSDGSKPQAIKSSMTSYRFVEELFALYFGSDLFTATSGYDLTASYDAVQNLLTFTLVADPTVTEEYTVIFTNGTDDPDYDVSAAEARFLGAPCRSNHFYVRPGTKPSGCDFFVDGVDDKFIWGPVIDAAHKTVTFDIRDRATTFQTGLYQLCLKNAADIAKANELITMFDENINTASNYLYVAPSLSKADGAVFKFTGVPSYASEPATYVYIEDNGNNTVNISAAGGAEFKNVPYTFAGGEITFNTYGVKTYTAEDNQGTIMYEPREMPALASGDGPSTYVVTLLDLTKYDAYRISYSGTYSASTRVRYAKTTPTGVSNYGKDDLFIVNKGYTAFQSVDFMPNDSRCVNVEIVSAPTKVDPGELRLTLDIPVRDYTVMITGDAQAADRVIYDNTPYTTGSTVPVKGLSLDPASIKTNVTDRFVWGPIIDEDHSTVQFEIRSAQSASLTPGWYQMQLVDRVGHVYNSAWKAGVNVVEEINKMAGFPVRGSYVYAFGANRDYNPTSRPYTLDMTGLPSNEASTYVYVAATDDAAKPAIMMQSGYFLNNNAQTTTYGDNSKITLDWESSTTSFRWKSPWLIPWYPLSPGNHYGFGATNQSQYSDGSSFIFHPVTNIKAYQVKVADGVKVTYNGAVPLLNDKSTLADGYVFFLPGDKDFERDGSDNIDASQFSLDYGNITGITVGNNGHGVATLEIATDLESLSNMIIHRQHSVYDRIAETDDLPSDNHIKRGGGFIPQPFAGTFPTTGYYENDRHMQNVSIFTITQYAKPGTSTECILPFTKNKTIENHVAQYQRWYDYQTERCLPDEVIKPEGTLVLTDKNGKAYTQFTNGHCNYGLNAGGTDIERLYENLAKADITLPVDKKEIFVGVDASENKNTNADIAHGNLVEPSLNERVVFHIISAHEMAKKLTTSGDTWLENKSYYVPNIKRGRDVYKNNADLIPLDMPFTNYWIYKTEGTVGVAQADAQLMPLVAESADAKLSGETEDQARARAYGSLKSNLDIQVTGTAASYIDVGVFDESPGNIGYSPYINTNHFLYYKIKGSSETREVPAGSEAVIKVYAKDGSQGDASPRYQLAKFTLIFEADSHPLPITSVIGNPASTRSVDYFIDKGYEEVASMTFENKTQAFTKIDNRRNDNNEPRTYAFPIDYCRTSYGYSPNYTYGNYSVTKQGWGIKYYPVAAYERNIKNPSITQMDIDDDYFFYIDAAETPGRVASVPLYGTLCAGSRLYCYGWLGSGNVHDAAGDDHLNPKSTGASVILQLIGIQADGQEDILASYLSGTLTEVAYDEDGNTIRSLSYGRTPSMEKPVYMEPNGTQVGVWNSIGFSFVLERNDYDSYEMRIINNCFSTAGGDYSLDDFRVFVAPAKARVEYAAPICYDHVPVMKVVIPREAVTDAVANASGNADLSYCFLNKATYDKELAIAEADATITDEEYNAAFTAALVGNGTNADVLDTDGNVVSHRSFWNCEVAKTDADYNNYRPYDFAKIVNETDGYTINGAYRQSTGSTQEIVFSSAVNSIDGWEDNTKYIIAMAQLPVKATDYHEAGTAIFSINKQSCRTTDVFMMKPSLTVNSDMPEMTITPASACEGQKPTISLDLHGYGLNHSVVLEHMPYDWWLGYGKCEDSAPIVPATVHNFDQVQHGGVYLRDALEHFRMHYPDETSVEFCGLKTAPEDNPVFSQQDKDCILHYLKPNEYGRVPLILGARTVTLDMDEADAVVEGGKKYIYFTVIPIKPYDPYDPNDDVIFCPDPQQAKVLIEGDAPELSNGFTKLNHDYPKHLKNVPFRMGLRQIEAVRLTSTGGMGEHHLRVPLRGIKKVHPNSPCLDKLVDRDQLNHHDYSGYKEYVILAATDDPAYSDRVIQGVDAFGNMDLLVVGRLSTYDAIDNGEDAHMEIGFSGDFRPREGYTYTLKAFFDEQLEPSHPDDIYVPCMGSLTFDLKIVPQYVQWNPAHNDYDWSTEWTNDDNWARADRDVLHADNPTSGSADKPSLTSRDSEHPFADYEANATNYSPEDARYTTGGNAHAFTPMYFTNVLMHDVDVAAPAMYAHTNKPTKDTGFLTGLVESKATPFIKYDMLVTPITEEHSYADDHTDHGMTPFALADRYAMYDCNFGCEPFWSNVCDGLTFEPGTAMYDAQHLLYNRVWVEYELSTKRWYTLASPLKGTYAGEWYSPEAGGRQLTPHFYPVTYNPALNDRFNPAYYQRSWDKKGQAWIYRMSSDEGTYVGFEHDYEHANNVRVQKPTYLNWSYVYNDVTVDYSTGGFSINVRYTDQGKDADGGKVLVRLPKDDLSYDYYQSEAAADYDAKHPADGNEQQSGDANPDPARPDGNGQGRITIGDNTVLENRKPDSEGHYPHPRLMSDDLKTPGASIGQIIQNASASNPYFLVGNPFMAPMNMDLFFEKQTCKRNGQTQRTFETGKYWILNGTSQDANIKVGGQWISTSDANAGVVAPLQGFFVQMPTNAEGQAILPDRDATSNNPVSSISLSFDENVQQAMVQTGTDNDGKPIFGYTTGNEGGQGQPIGGGKPSLKARRRCAATEQPTMFRITATNGSELESTAVVYFTDKASARYDAREDAETLLDSNIAGKVSTVFTSADEQALQINTMPAGVTVIPVGVIAPKDDTRTTLRFTGLNALEAAMAETPHLYDAAEGTLQVLDEGTTVSVTGTTAGRYFIVSGTTLPVVDDNDDDNDNLDGRIYDLRGIRVNSVQHGTVTISRSRKEYNK